MCHLSGHKRGTESVTSFKTCRFHACGQKQQHVTNDKTEMPALVKGSGNLNCIVIITVESRYVCFTVISMFSPFCLGEVALQNLSIIDTYSVTNYTGMQ